MADELTISASMGFVKGTVDVSFAKSGLTLTITGTDYVLLTQATAVTPGAALDLGGIGTPGYFIGYNSDGTDNILVRQSTSTTDGNMVKISPGMIAMFEFDDTDATAPFVMASANTPVLEYLLVEA